MSAAAASRGKGWLIAIGLFGFAASLVAGAPASLVASIIAARVPLAKIGDAKGTIWKGEFRSVSYNNILIGDVAFSLRPFSLLMGRVRADVRSGNGALQSVGDLTLADHSVTLRNVDARFNLGAVRQYTFFGVRYQGEASIKASRLVLSRKSCIAEGVDISTNVFDAMARQWSGAAFPMTGAATCEEGALKLALRGSTQDGAATINALVRPDLTYVLTVAAQPKRRDVGEALRLFGFEPKASGLTYEAAGVLKGLSS
jgi:hypothetical protein